MLTSETKGQIFLRIRELAGLQSNGSFYFTKKEMKQIVSEITGNCIDNEPCSKMFQNHVIGWHVQTQSDARPDNKNLQHLVSVLEFKRSLEEDIKDEYDDEILSQDLVESVRQAINEKFSSAKENTELAREVITELASEASDTIAKHATTAKDTGATLCNAASTFLSKWL